LTRVLFLQQQPCMRALKYGVGLRSTDRAFELGFACQGKTLTEWYGTGDELFDRWWRIGADPGADLVRVLEEFRPDVIHSHNLPDRLTVLALELVDGRVPVIHDVHDLQSLRVTPYEDGFPEPADPLLLEKQAIGGCTALVAVSDEMVEAIGARHSMPQRTVPFANYALARDLPARLPEHDDARGGPVRMVYQGTLSTNGGHYDLRALFRAVVDQRVLLDIYPARPAPDYDALAEATPGMTCHEMQPPQRLMQLLPQYDLGWAGFNAELNGPHLDTALPNKVFEYIGCGLPVITLRHRALERFLAEEGVGVSVPSVDELAAHLDRVDLAQLRRQVIATRARFTMEANIERITHLYDDVVGG
jgi:glycosyltransferase involved in cell wall biosynthesis